MEIYVKKLISVFSFFSGFQSRFCMYIDFTHFAASNTANHDVAN